VKIRSKIFIFTASPILLTGLVCAYYYHFCWPIHRYYRGETERLRIQLEFYPKGVCGLSLTEHAKPDIAYIHVGKYRRMDNRITVSWQTMKGFSQFELRDPNVYLPPGSLPGLSAGVTIEPDPFNIPKEADRPPLPLGAPRWIEGPEP
jgi:hypothetical protein